MKTGLFGEPVEFEHYANGRVLFKLKDLVNLLRLEWKGQCQKTSSDPHGRYCIVDERFNTPDGKTAISKAIPAENVMNFLDDINVNRVSKEAMGRVLNLRNSLRGENLAELALRNPL